MQFEAKARYVWYSPYKLRPLADVVRGKSARFALDWLTTYQTKRALPLKKLIASAIANAQNLQNVPAESLTVHEIRVDQGLCIVILSLALWSCYDSTQAFVSYSCCIEIAGSETEQYI